MLKPKDKEKVEQIQVNQEQIIASLKNAEEKAYRIGKKVEDRARWQRQMHSQIESDASTIEKESEVMRAKVQNIADRVMNLVKLSEEIGIQLMRNKAAKEIEQIAQEVEVHSNKKKKALEEMKKSFSQM